MASDSGSGSGDSMDRRTDFPGLWFLTAAAISFLLDSRRDFGTCFRCLSWKCGTGPLCSCDRSVSCLGHGKERLYYRPMAGTRICKFNFRSGWKCGKVKRVDCGRQYHASGNPSLDHRKEQPSDRHASLENE